MSDAQSEAFDLIGVGLAYDGEKVTGPGDLSDDIDELAELAQMLGRITQTSRRVRSEVEAHLAAVLGPGQKHRYGDHLIAWKHGWKWKPLSGLGAFVVDAVTIDPAWVLDLFSLGNIRKTGVEKVARLRGLDPELVVTTVLDREYEPEPSLQWKWQPIEENSHDEREDD